MDAVSFFIALLVLINPYALFVYLNPIIAEVGERVFLRINGFFVGAFGVNLVVEGIQQVFGAA